MELNDPTATINALLCACVVITLMFYRRGDSRHRPWISRLAWLLTVIYSAVPLAYLCGIYPYSSWATIVGHYRGQHYFPVRAGRRQRQCGTSG